MSLSKVVWQTILVVTLAFIGLMLGVALSPDVGYDVPIDRH